MTSVTLSKFTGSSWQRRDIHHHFALFPMFRSLCPTRSFCVPFSTRTNVLVSGKFLKLLEDARFFIEISGVFFKSVIDKAQSSSWYWA